MSEHEEVIVWWKLAIEMIADEKRFKEPELNAHNLAGEVYARYYSLGTPPFEKLLEACDDYLERLNDPLTCPGFVPFDFNILSNTIMLDLSAVEIAKRTLLMAHIKKMGDYVNDRYRDDDCECDCD